MHEVAEQLGVHYMTAYRYVRLGMLPARKVGATWQIRPTDLVRFRRDAVTPVRPPAGRVDRSRPTVSVWAGRFEARILAGDLAGAWAVLEAALASGADLVRVELDVVSPAMVSIGRRWADGQIDIADEHRASAIVARLLARLGARFARPGRTKGCVLVGAAPGDQHGLPVTILTDLLAVSGFEVADLGPDVPASSFAHAAAGSERLVAVGVGVTAPGLDASVEATVAALHDAVPGVPVLVGGQAVDDEAHARRLGADGWAADGRSAVALVERLARSR